MPIHDLFPIDKWNFKSRSILHHLPPEDHALLLAHQTEQHYKKGELIFREGSLPTGIFYVQQGMVKKFKSDPNGGDHIIYVAGAGEIIGYHAVLSGERFADSAAALEHCLIAFVPKAAFLAALEQSRILNTRLLQLLGHEFTVFVNNLTLFAQRPVRQRFALQLILLREKYKPVPSPASATPPSSMTPTSPPAAPSILPPSATPSPPPDVTSAISPPPWAPPPATTVTPSIAPVEINLSREDLASLVGARRENIVRTLAEFKKQGILITRGRKIIIRDIKRLIDIANFK